MIWVLLICFSAQVEAGKYLPDQMLGEFKLETSEGFTDFMYEIGVRWIKRQIACTLYPVQQIKEADDGEISVDTLTTFKSLYTKFKLNEPWEEYTGDGRYTKTTTTVQDLSLIKVQIPKPDATFNKTTREVRQFSPDGQTMTVINTIEGLPNKKSVRVYKRTQ
ncbi:fatty acid-binding protein [Eurytemora carolleeae]|uniref:fatty acid-binding protein n=1 Tax=Eurytemora carolleeae TaxID=1294199 RepID=UPI000C7838C7|nr:fatty acid-binding protein [Eurytemora carolleeae]|eukprot:XP_023348461.1 fatty acid-binding protein-like [Eurytemora affinis]